MKKFLKFFLVYISLILIFIFLLVLSCMFPSSLIKKNVKKSSKTLNLEGNRKICFIINKFQFQEFDNYSDALMINIAYSIDNKTPLFSAFTAKKDYIPGVTKKIEKDFVGELKSSSKYNIHNEVGELEDTVNDEGVESFEYAKYWHGYLIFLRPLLLLFDYQQIRIILSLILGLLAIFVTSYIAIKKDKTIAIFFLFSLVCVEYFYIGLSLINSIPFLIMMIFSLILVKEFKKIKDYNLFFFIIGCFIGFFGLLDIPLITLCGPMLLFFVFNDGDGKNNFKIAIKFLVFWILGYFITWMTKWILMDLIYNRNLIKIALCQVLYRSVGNNIPKLLAICMNLLYMVISIMLIIILSIFIYIRNYKKVNNLTRKKSIIFLLISFTPFIWYFLLSNHSYYHCFFTYRLLFISIFSILLWVYYLCGEADKL